MEEHVRVGRQLLSWRRQWSPLRLYGLVRQDLLGIHKHRFVLRNLVATQLKVRYQRSTLGFLWTLLNPILMLSVLAVVFSQMMRMNLAEYAVYLFSGLVPWQFFAGAVTDGSRSLITHEILVKKVDVRKLVFPLSDVLVAGVNMVFALVALFILFQFVGAKMHVQLILLPVGLFYMALFAFGVALLLMTLVIYFRDFEHITIVLLQAFYFACPIIYPPGMVGRFQGLLRFNPMTHLLRFFQCAIYYGDWPSPETWVGATVSAFVALAAGYVAYKRCEQDYVFRL